MENKKIYFDYKTYIEIYELVNRLIDEFDNINYDRENVENVSYRNNAENIHKALLEKLGEYKRD